MKDGKKKLAGLLLVWGYVLGVGAMVACVMVRVVSACEFAFTKSLSYLLDGNDAAMKD